VTGGLDVEELRAELAADTPIWMQHGGGSPWPRAARDAVVAAAHELHASMDWTARYGADRAALRQALARLVGGQAEGITLVRSTGHGLSLLARGLDWRPGDNVVGARWEYPTNLYPWMALERQGVELRLADPVDGRITVGGLMALADERTRAVCVSWVQFWNGYRIDLDAIGAACHERGIVFCVDGIQGVGAVQLDVERAGIDLLSCGAIKWLLGTPGTGFAYVSPRLVPLLQPLTVGIGSVVQTEQAFEPELDWNPTARRFEESATSWFDIVAFLACVRLLERHGMPEIEQRVLDLTARLGEELAAGGHQVVAPWPRARVESSGIVSFRTPGTAPADQVRRLAEAGVVARVHSDFVRLSPHAWTRDTEIDRALAALAVP
jgi:cysteine desulfurase/selenocysteine lyase